MLKKYDKIYYNIENKIIKRKKLETKSVIKINPDTEMAKLAREMLKENDGYCPCALDKNEDTKCMCKYFRELESGMCNCGLFIKVIETK